MLMKPDQYDAQFEVTETASVKSGPGLIGRAVARIEEYVALRKSRRALLELDDHLLHDVGLSRADAERLAAKPFRWFGRNSDK